MPVEPEQCYSHPNALAPHYARFRVSERILLTGHSHQAWPDCAFEGQQRAWLIAAEQVDGKWERAFEKAEAVRVGFARLLNDESGHIALGQNTHELVVRFLSALPLKARPRIVTTDGEFHTLRRQLGRLAEEGIEVVRVEAHPAAGAAERLARALDGRTAAVMVSSVFYQSGHIVPGLGGLMTACRRAGAELLVDAYHSLNVVPFDLKGEGLEGAFVVGGGYKYCQLGEGNGFLRFPEDCDLRPVITGWFSEFDGMAGRGGDGGVAYERGPLRFAGSTYDPTSHYRAEKVFRFFTEQGLTPEVLRRISRHQVGLLARRFDELDGDPRIIDRDRTVPLEAIGGFLTLKTRWADELCRRLGTRGVHTDHRGDVLRLGPAPYLSDRQLVDAVEVLGSLLPHLDR